MQSNVIIWLNLFRIVSHLLWFHPLVWNIRGAHSVACEEVCDGVGADYVGCAQSYSETLARVALDAEMFDTYLKKLIKDEEGKKNTRKATERGIITGLFDTGRGMDIQTIRNTAWAGYNAVTEYIDHHRKVKGSRLSSIGFGNGNRFKEKALEVATDMFLVGSSSN